MAKLSINTEDAIKQVAQLISEMEVLRQKFEDVQRPGAKGFREVQKAGLELSMATVKLIANMHELNQVIAENKKKAQEASTPYKELVKQLKAAKENMQNANLVYGVNSQAAAKAREEHDKLDKKLKEANTTLQKHTDSVNKSNRAVVQDAVNRVKSSQALQKQKQAAIEFNRPYNVLIRNHARAKKALLDSTIATGKNSKETRRLRREYNLLDKRLKSVRISSGLMNKSVGRLSRSFYGLGNIARGALAVLGVTTIVDFGRQILNTVKSMDSMMFTLNAVTKSAVDNAISIEFLKDVSDDYGLSLLETASRYSKFLAASKQAQFTLTQTQEIFKNLSQAIGTLGLKNDEARNVFLAIEQMVSKGKITTEELRRQLGERLPGAMDILANSIGVTTQELDKMLKKGEVLTYDVLPKFSKAIAEAYKSGERVDTVIAAQNRMGNAWDTLILKIERGTGAFSKAFKDMFWWAEKSLEYIGKFFGYLQADLDEITYRAFADKTREITGEFENVVSEIGKASNATNKWIQEFAELYAEDPLKGKEFWAVYKIKKLDEELNKLDKKLLENTSLKVLTDSEAEELERALNNYDSMFELTKNASKLTIAEMAKYHKNFNEDAFYSEEELVRIAQYVKANYDLYNRQAIQNKKDIADIEGRKKAYEDFYKVKKKTEGDESEGGNKMVSLKKEKDLQYKIEQEKLKQSIDLNNLMIENKSVHLEDVQELLTKNKNFEIEIAKSMRDETMAIAKDYDAKEKARIVKLLSEKKITQKQYDDKMIELQDSFNDKKELAELEYNRRKKEADKKEAEAYFGALEKYNQIEVDMVEDTYNQKLIEAGKVYAAEIQLAGKDQKKITEAWEKYETKKKEISVEMANAIIDAKIAIAEATKATLNPETDAAQIAEIDRMINKLEASKARLDPTKDKGKSLIADSLEYELRAVLDMAGALTDVFDQIAARRIENINAEIEAERRKYETLIRFAENDQSKKEALEAEREIKIRELERKRLKEEQKQAKLRKAFALAEIAINTAIAISKATTLGPVLGIPAVAWAKALGALQVAAVLAAPIPQYKDGLDEADKDHIAMINDGGQQEFIKRGNKILTTKQKDAIVDLKKGDTVYKNYDDMVAKNMILSGLNGGQLMSPNDYRLLSSTIENSIDKGFKKAKINNVINIRNVQTQNYLNAKARR